MIIKRYQRLNYYIKNEITGPVKELAEKLEVCEKTVKNMVNRIRMEADCEIGFDRSRNTYYYVSEQNADFKLGPDVKDQFRKAFEEFLKKIFVLSMSFHFFYEFTPELSTFLPSIF